MSKGKRESIFNPSVSNINVGHMQNGKNPDSVPARERIRATNELPLKFRGTLITEYTDTQSIGSMVNDAFKDIFEDYYGCIISADPNSGIGRNVKVDLYFTPMNTSIGDDDTRAFVSVDAPTNNTTDRLMALVNKNIYTERKDHVFDLTSYASEILFDFLPDTLTRGGMFGKQKVDWARPETYRPLITETTDPTETGARAMCCIDSIDIVKVLGFIYGTKDPEDESSAWYNVALDRPASNNPNVLGANWIVTVTRMTKDQYLKAMPKLGQNPMMGRLPINTIGR